MLLQVFPGYSTSSSDGIPKIKTQTDLFSKVAITKLSPEQLLNIHNGFVQMATEELQKYVTNVAYKMEDKSSTELSPEERHNLVKRSSVDWGARLVNATCPTTENPVASNEIVSVVYQESDNIIQEYKYHVKNSQVYETVTNYELGPVNVHKKYVTELKTVHIVSQVPENIEVYERFLENLKEVCKPEINGFQGRRCEIYTVLFKDDLEAAKFDFSAFNKINYKMEMTYGLDVKVGEIGGEPFSLGRLLQIVSDSYSTEDLIFLVDAHYSFNGTFLDRCIANTELSSQVYYPIAYTDKTATQSEKEEDNKHLPALCVYTNDIQNLDMFPKNYKQLYQAFVSSSTLNVFSVADVSLTYVV